MRPHPDRERGFSLVLVLWVVVLLSAVAGAALHDLGTHARMGNVLVHRTAAKAAAEGAVYAHIAELLGVPGASAPLAVRRAEAPITSAFSIDEANLLDLNLASEKALELLLAGKVGAADAHLLTQRVMDWRDADDTPRPDGAELAQYRATTLGFGPRNAPFQHPSELSQVLGMPPALVEDLRDELSIYSGRSYPRPGEQQASVLPSSAGNAGQSGIFRVVAQATVGGATVTATVSVMIIRGAAPVYHVLSWEWG